MFHLRSWTSDNIVRLWDVDERMNPFLQTASGVVSLILVAASATSCNPWCNNAPAACEMSPEPGPCFAAITKFYFDQEAQECREFTWGGCGGVVPFDTFDECQECQCD
ncbi:MAG TPA: proteinase inhibitor I4 serpin [Flavobacteriales bacterium]|nr:proteinase inhibitor I4 serpin [Flavobacteriales bacterium]